MLSQSFNKLCSKELTMDSLVLSTLVIAAAQYSLIYLLLGGSFSGAIVIYIVAKMLGR